MVAKFKGGGGGAALGQMIQLYPSYPDDVELNGQHFIRQGFVTEDFDPALSPPRFNTAVVANDFTLGGSYQVTSGTDVYSRGDTTIAPVNYSAARRTKDDWQTADTLALPLSGSVNNYRPLFIGLGNQTWLAIAIWDTSATTAIAKSTDDCDTWTIIDKTIFGANPNFTDVDTNGTGTVLINVSGQCYRTTDYGATWQLTSMIYNGHEEAYGNIWWAGGNIWIARNRYGEFWRSVNNGSSWSQMTTMPTNSVLGIGSGSVGAIRKSAIKHDVATGLTWVFSSNQAWSSSNGGATWQLMFTMPLATNAPVNYGGGLWVKYVNTKSIAFSEDDGQNWTTTNDAVGYIAGNFVKCAGQGVFFRPTGAGKMMKAIQAFGIAALTSPDASSYFVRYK